ncbi:MAG: hypothetical protein QOK37_1576 [Thermoanaerobaculia bacterium]|jgi:hypothetical protein|nr:hypothetical protein [Thermoanaerobaculia bacterium]
MLYKGLPVDSLKHVNYIAVRNYIKSRGWTRIGNGTGTALFRSPSDPDAEVLLPLSKMFSDYSMRIGDLILAVSEIEQIPPVRLMADLLLPPSDILRFSVQATDTSSGTVQFDSGMDLYAGIRTAMLSSARAAEHPEKYFERLKDSDDFVSQCRLGQTEFGSFTATFVCPVEALPEIDVQPDLFADLAHAPTAREPFARKVTRTLMQAVAIVANAIANDTVADLIASTGPVSANLCEALLRMEPVQDGQLTVASSWARVLIPPADTAAYVVIPKEYFGPIAEIATALRPSKEPKDAPFVGKVITLAGQEHDGELSGPVTLYILTDDEPVRARVSLSHDDYMKAYDAHGRMTAVSITGKLKRASRSAEIIDYTDFKLV